MWVLRREDVMRKDTLKEREGLRHVVKSPQRFRGDEKGKRGGKREQEKSKTTKTMTPFGNQEE